MGFFSSLFCMLGGIFCLSFYCKKINENLEDEVIIVKIKRSDIVDENGNPINRPPQYTEFENIRNGDSEEIPLLENEVTNEEPPQYSSNLNRTRQNENSDNINNSISNINNVSTVTTTTNTFYTNL